MVRLEDAEANKNLFSPPILVSLFCIVLLAVWRIQFFQVRGEFRRCRSQMLFLFFSAGRISILEPRRD
jgi:hypothetical protein